MNRGLFFLVLSAALTAARAELPIDLPSETATNRPVPGINVPAPLGTDEPTDMPTNTVVVPPSPKANLLLMPPLKRVSLPADGQDSLTFTNGDRFAGVFAGQEGGVIRWQLPLLKEPVRFRPIGMDAVVLATRAEIKAAPVTWLVFLTDGSLLPARQIAVEGGQVVADLVHVGQARLERAQVATLRRCEQFITLGDAPCYGNAAAGDGFSRVIRYREMKLPDALLLEFPWTGDAGQAVSFRMFTGKPEELDRAPSSFHLSFSAGGAAMLYVYSVGVGSMLKFAEPCTNRTAQPLWVGLAVNRKSGEAALYLDGQLRRRGALDPLNLPDFGLALVETGQGPTVPRYLVISGINENLALPAPPVDQDAVRLANGDQVAGKLESVSTNEAVIQAAMGRLVLPLERVVQVSLARGAPVTPRAGEALVALQDGALLRGVWQRADAQNVVVQHAVLGPVTFPRTLLAEVDYHTDLAAGTNQWRIGAHRIRLRLIQVGADIFTWRMMNMQLPPQFGVIQVRNNQSWHGDLLAIANGSVRWQHPAALDPFALSLADVQRIRPLLRPLPVTPVAERATVVLANGDVISGLLAPGEDDDVRVTPWYLGALVIPRRQVARLTPHAPVPDALQWDMQLTDGALWTDTTPRTGTLPDRLRLDFEAVWGERLQYVNAKLYQDENTHLLAMFHQRSMDLGEQVANRIVSTNITSGALTNISVAGCATVTILADRTNRYLRVLVDGHPAGEWRGSDQAAPTGHGLSISGYGTGVALRHIVLREWREDPVLAPAQQLAAPAARAPADARVILHNGDFLTLSDIAADTQTVTGRHALLGPVTLNRTGVRSLSWEPGTDGASPAKR